MSIMGQDIIPIHWHLPLASPINLHLFPPLNTRCVINFAGLSATLSSTSHRGFVGEVGEGIAEGGERMQQSYSKLAYQPSYLICLLHLNAILHDLHGYQILSTSTRLINSRTFLSAPQTWFTFAGLRGRRTSARRGCAGHVHGRAARQMGDEAESSIREDKMGERRLARFHRHAQHTPNTDTVRCRLYTAC